jgi:hypothetical protein
MTGSLKRDLGISQIRARTLMICPVSIADCGNVEKNPIFPEDCPTATSAAIASQLGERFKIEDLLEEGQTSGSHNVFVVGLAGDWCVKDTAMNIMKYVKRRGVNSTV